MKYNEMLLNIELSKAQLDVIQVLLDNTCERMDWEIQPKDDKSGYLRLVTKIKESA